MSARSRMTHRCTVQRWSHDDTDRYVVPGFSTHIESQPCWLYARDGREAVRAEGTVVVDPLKMLVPMDADIKPADRIVEVIDRAGDPVLAGPFDIQNVLPHHTHAELVLSRVSGGAVVPA